MEIVRAVTAAQLDQVRELISEYYDQTLHHERVDQDFVRKILWN